MFLALKLSVLGVVIALDPTFACHSMDSEFEAVLPMTIES